MLFDTEAWQRKVRVNECGCQRKQMQIMITQIPLHPSHWGWRAFFLRVIRSLDCTQQSGHKTHTHTHTQTHRTLHTLIHSLVNTSHLLRFFLDISLYPQSLTHTHTSVTLGMDGWMDTGTRKERRKETINTSAICTTRNATLQKGTGQCHKYQEQE